jgi:hypothetical protein
MLTDVLTHPTVKATIDALQRGDRAAWSAQFEPDAKLYDDGSPRSLEKFRSSGKIKTEFSCIRPS